MSPLAMLKLAWAARKWVGIVVAILAAVWLIWGWISAYGDHRADKARAAVMALWEADKQARDKVDAKLIADAQVRENAARQHGDEVVNDYAQKLAAAAGSRDEYFGLLQRARNQVRALATGQTDSAERVIAACQATGTEQLDSAIAAALVESRENAAQLNALIAVVKPQL